MGLGWRQVEIKLDDLPDVVEDNEAGSGDEAAGDDDDGDGDELFALATSDGDAPHRRHVGAMAQKLDVLMDLMLTYVVAARSLCWLPA